MKVTRARITKQLTAITRSVRGFERAVRGLVPLLASLNGAPPAKGARRPLKLTPKRRAELKLQGRYLGYMRQLKPREKSRVRAVREKKGMLAAIRLAKGLVTDKAR